MILSSRCGRGRFARRAKSLVRLHCNAWRNFIFALMKLFRGFRNRVQLNQNIFPPNSPCGSLPRAHCLRARSRNESRKHPSRCRGPNRSRSLTRHKTLLRSFREHACSGQRLLRQNRHLPRRKIRLLARSCLAGHNQEYPARQIQKSVHVRFEKPRGKQLPAAPGHKAFFRNAERASDHRPRNGETRRRDDREFRRLPFCEG